MLRHIFSVLALVLAFSQVSAASAQGTDWDWREPRTNQAYALVHGASYHFGNERLKSVLGNWGYMNEFNPGFGVGFYVQAPDWMGPTAEMSFDLSVYSDTWGAPAVALKGSVTWAMPVPGLRAGFMLGVNYKKMSPWAPHTVWPIAMAKVEYRFAEHVSLEVMFVPYVHKYTDFGLFTFGFKVDLPKAGVNLASMGQDQTYQPKTSAMSGTWLDARYGTKGHSFGSY